MWCDALYLMLIFMSRCPSSSIIFRGKFFFLNYQRKFLHGKSYKVRRHLTTCFNFFSNFSQKSTIIILFFHVTIKRTLIFKVYQEFRIKLEVPISFILFIYLNFGKGQELKCKEKRSHISKRWTMKIRYYNILLVVKEKKNIVDLHLYQDILTSKQKNKGYPFR